jgi:hypothetical protein
MTSRISVKMCLTVLTDRPNVTYTVETQQRICDEQSHVTFLCGVIAILCGIWLASLSKTIKKHRIGVPTDILTKNFPTKSPWPYSASELYWPSNSRFSARLVPTFADKRCIVVRATDPYGRILGFLDRSRYFFVQLAPQLYSRGWEDSVPDTLLLRNSGNAGNPTRTSGSVARKSDH